MRRQSFKMAMIGGVVALIVLFGIDIATSGVQRINGPFGSDGALPVNRTGYDPDGGWTYPPSGQAGSGDHANDGLYGGQPGGGYAGGGYGGSQAGAYGQYGGDDGWRSLPENSDAYGQQPPRSVAEAERSRWSGGRTQQPEAAQQQPPAPQNERLPGLPDTRRDSSVNKLADGAAGLLQSVSSEGIRFIVSFFDSITD
ncbi:hypothetical protein [Paenibacillus humicola]|uniref:hypothetical protein n=1 Tax=Paenibacillus humicola TaxID=3110540 RepID=UPI00237B9AF4|nr:hypothetical protein [Paenibacillus humicola]